MTSISTDSNKKSRRSIVWNRFTHPTGGYSSCKAWEQPPLPILKMILDNEYAAPEVVTNIRSLRQYAEKLRRSGGQVTSIYAQKLFDKYSHAEVPYTGVSKLGRAYCGSALNGFPRKIVNTLYKQTHVDLDIQNCFPTMLANAFGDVSIPGLKKVAFQRADVVHQLRQDIGITSESAKKMILATICGYPKYPQIAEDELVMSRDFNNHTLIKQFRRDLSVVVGEIGRRYPGYAAMIKNRATQEDGVDHQEGYMMQLMAEDMEFVVMRKLMAKIFADDDAREPNLVWYFDGMVIPREVMKGEAAEDWLGELQAYIMDDLGIKLVLQIKDLSPSFPISLGMNELHSPYLRWKMEFEKTYFKVVNPSVHVRIQPDGTLQELNDVAFKHVTAEQPAEFMKDWRTDSNKRSYEGFCNVPPPKIPPHDKFNKYVGFAAETWDPIGEEEDISLDKYFQHVHLLCGGSTDAMVHRYEEYLHNWLAFKFQNPGLLTRTILFLHSVQGVGKDTWADFIAGIMGWQNVVKFGTAAKLIATSAMVDSKLLAIVSETNYKEIKESMEELKDLCTSEHIVVTKKYVNAYEIENTCEFIFFSNQSDAFTISADERRIFPLRASGLKAKDQEYFQDLIPYLQDKRVMRKAFEFYMARDISGFNPCVRPRTNAFIELTASNSLVLDSILQEMVVNGDDNNSWVAEVGSQGIRLVDGVLRVPSSIVLDKFMDKVASLNYHGADSRPKMQALMDKQIIQVNGCAQKYHCAAGDELRTVIGRTYKSCQNRMTRFRLFDVVGLTNYYKALNGEDEEGSEVVEQDNGAYASGFHPGQQSSSCRSPA